MTTFSTTGNFVTIALQASSGKYVTCDGADVLRAVSDTIGPGEVFQMMLDQNDRFVGLKAYNGKYVSSPFVPNQQDGALPLAALGDSIGVTELFRMDDWGDQLVAIFAPNQKYIQVMPTGATLQALGDASSAASFKLLKVDVQGAPVPDAVQANAFATRSVASANLLEASSPTVLTVCFAGTACTRDEGEISRQGSQKEIYAPASGYIPIRIHREISGNLRATSPSVSIRGVGQNDWANNSNSEPLLFNGVLDAPSSLLSYVASYSGGDQYSLATQVNGWSAPALALHAANLAAASGKQQLNFVAHSRGAVEAIMAAWFIYAYGPANVKNIPINIFAIDPVPGTGEWYGIFTQLPPNVVNYVGVYAWDMCLRPLDGPFMALVPRPNGRMTGKGNPPALYKSWWPNKWKYIADNYQLADPLMAGNDPQPVGYELFACRGRHSTLSGNRTAQALYDAADASDTVLPVPELIYKMARGYLTRWGTAFPQASAAQQRVLALRQAINTVHRDFDLMGGGETRTSAWPLRPYVRRLSSISGMNPNNSYYMDNVVGNPPYKMAYPVTSERQEAGWVKWQFL